MGVTAGGGGRRAAAPSWEYPCEWAHCFGPAALPLHMPTAPDASSGAVGRNPEFLRAHDAHAVRRAAASKEAFNQGPPPAPCYIPHPPHPAYLTESFATPGDRRCLPLEQPPPAAEPWSSPGPSRPATGNARRQASGWEPPGGWQRAWRAANRHEPPLPLNLPLDLGAAGVLVSDITLADLEACFTLVSRSAPS